MKKHLLLISLAALTVCACGPKEEPLTRDFDPPIMGWSSWNYFKTEISEDIICRQADALISTGLADAGYVYVNIDDGFTDGRGEDGRIRIDTTKFPNGMKVVADYVHSLGLKAGMYSDAGDNTCASHDVQPYGLNVGLYGHEVEDCKMMFDEWGYDFFKVDNCGGRHLPRPWLSATTRTSTSTCAAGYSPAPGSSASPTAGAPPTTSGLTGSR